VHAKTVKNTENTDGQKNEIQRKNKENSYSRPKFGTKQKVYFDNTGTEGSVFYCIFSNTTGKYLYWHAQLFCTWLQASPKKATVFSNGHGQRLVTTPIFPNKRTLYFIVAFINC
jgi:hypothetical protein